MQTKVSKRSRSFKTSRENSRLAEMKADQFPLPRRKVKDNLQQRGMNFCHETAWLWWHRFGRRCRWVAPILRCLKRGMSGKLR